MLSQRALKLSSFRFPALLHSSDSRSRVRPAASFAPAIPSAAFFTAVIVQFCLLFKSPSSPLAVSCIFLVCASILLVRSWIAFAVTTLNSLSGGLPVCTRFSHSSGVLSCSIVCHVFLCRLICGLHSAACKTAVPLASVCPLVGEASQRGLCRLPGGTDWCLPTGG